MAADGDDGREDLLAELPTDPDLPPPPPRDPRRRHGERTVLLVVATAGALGALARYGLGHLVDPGPGRFPWGTFWTNVSGSLALGLVLVLLAERFPHSQLARPLLATGFLGAYTTFSTYVVGTDLLLRTHEVATAVAYALASLVAGTAAALAGILLGRALSRLHRTLGHRLP